MTEMDLFKLEPSKPHQCTHWSEGRRCRAIAMHNEYFCVRHRVIPVPHVIQNEPFDLEHLDSREAIQRALGDLAARLATNRMDLKRASILAYTLQVASSNLGAKPPAEIPARLPLNDVTPPAAPAPDPS